MTILLSALLVFSLIPSAFSQNQVVKLYSETLSLPGCKIEGVNSCSKLDGTEKSFVEKPVVIERFVPGSGFLGVAIHEGTVNSGAKGGLDLQNINFEPSSGGKAVNIGNGLQVFESGKVVANFYQLYRHNERLESKVEITLWYLPHTDIERQQFLLKLRKDEQAFDAEKKKNERSVGALCESLKNEAGKPTGCSGGTVTNSSSSSSSASFGQKTDPSGLAELDFSRLPSREPEITIKKSEILAFVGEPLNIAVDQVHDPDGKCNLWEFFWKKPKRLSVEKSSVDPRYGDLRFTPLSKGVYLLQLRVQESCKSLGTLASGQKQVRLIVNDKDSDFADLKKNPYQDFIYQLYHEGAMKGFSDTTMQPNALITRAEFLKVLFSALHFDIKASTFSPKYSDVPLSVWFAPYVYQADRLGVVKGYPDGLFHPERPVNLVEALKIALEFTDLKITDQETVPFADVKNTDWFSRFVQSGVREGIWDEAKEKGKVKPGQQITRGQAAKIIVRTFLFPANRLSQANPAAQLREDEYEDFSSFSY